MKMTFLVLTLALTSATGTGTAQSGGTNVEQKLSVPIPNIPGKSLKTMIVTYAPGAGSRPHIHAPSAFIYAHVIEGGIRSQVNGGSPVVYKAGDFWTENPGDHHQISENVSKVKPARMLVVFVADTADKSLTAADQQ